MDELDEVLGCILDAQARCVRAIREGRYSDGGHLVLLGEMDTDLPVERVEESLRTLVAEGRLLEADAGGEPGYITPGFVDTVAALLREHRQPCYSGHQESPVRFPPHVRRRSRESRERLESGRCYHQLVEKRYVS